MIIYWVGKNGETLTKRQSEANVVEDICIKIGI